MGLALVVPLVVVGCSTAPAGGGTREVTEEVLRVPVGPESGGAVVTLDASVFTTGQQGAPAVVLAHGYGGTKDDLAARARALAGAGYVVLTYTARGFGDSGGLIHLGSPAFEGADVVAVVDVLAARGDVARDDGEGPGAPGSDPVVGVAGASYGGAAALLSSGLDPRVDAVAAAITWSGLRGALVPQSATPLDPAAAPAPGVLKQGWVAQLLASGGSPTDGPADGSGAAPVGGPPVAPATCGRLAADLCAAYLATVQSGGAPPTRELLALLEASSPAAVLAARGGARAPTLLVQGEADTLFGLEESLITADVLRAGGAPVEVVWFPGGHDAIVGVEAELGDRLQGFFDGHLVPDATAAPGNEPVDDGEDDGEDGGGTGTASRFEYALPLPALAALVGGGGDGGSGSDTTTDGDADSTDDGDDGAPLAPRRVLPDVPSSQAPPAQGVPAAELALAPVAGTGAAPVAGGAQQVLSPAGGQPAARTSLPGLGALSALPVPALAAAGVLPGQSAVFETAPLAEPLEVLGAPTVDVVVTSSAPDAVLFAALYDVDAGGLADLPGGLVAPLRVTAPAATATAVRVRLPTVVRDVPAGHRLRLVLASTDAAFAVPLDARAYTVALAPAQGGAAGGGVESGAGVLRVALAAAGAEPVAAAGSATAVPRPQAVVAAVLVLGALLLATLAWWRGRRTRTGATAGGAAPDPAEEAGAVLEVRGLTKAYADGHRAVDDASFTVARGQVVGLLGPNGAGKTTTLRVLLGLLRPTSGSVTVLGQPVVPGAPVLARVGALVEGPGFLPHLSGQANLELFWEATGRPAEQAHLQSALDVADLGSALDRPVRSYSQGMRMRLGIAQALLGRPELLVLDEPTNGLDPPQITAMRQVLRDYAATGATVLISSHLLSEVEQTCSHVVVMARGQVLAAGSVAELVGSPGASRTLALSVAPGDADAAVGAVSALVGAGAQHRGNGEVVITLDGAPRAAGAAQVVSALVGAGVAVHALVPRRQLEQVFLDLVGQGR